MASDQMQNQLNQIYVTFKKQANFRKELRDRLSPPLLLKVSDTWTNSKQRVLIIGQETLGWSFRKGEYYEWPYTPVLSFKDFKNTAQSVDAMVHGYSCFEFAKYQPENYRSPFWKAYRQVRKANGDQRDGIETTVLWTNLFRMSLDDGSVVNNGTKDEVIAIRESSAGLLLSEIEILKPTSVIFFTGPEYNDFLYSEFKNCNLVKFKNYDVSRTSLVDHPILPAKTVRTYHPGYLNRGHWDIVDQIIEQVID